MKVIKLDGNYKIREIVFEIDITEKLVSLMKTCSNHQVGLFEYRDEGPDKKIFVLRDKQNSYQSNKDECENSLN